MKPQKFAALVRLGLGIRRVLLSLADLVVPAHYALFERSIGLSQTMMLRVASELGIADVVEKERLSCEALARRTGANEDVLRRILRSLASRGIFRIRSDLTIAPTRLSRTLLSHRFEATRDWTQYFGSESNMKAWSDLIGSVRDGHSAFDRTHGMTVWEWFEQHPEEEIRFARSMMGVTRIQAPVILSLFDFSAYAIICDIGGGRGTLLSAILQAHPTIKAKLFDSRGVLESARVLMDEQGLSARVEYVPGSFFEAVPRGADLYILKNILHDWDDAVCLAILKSVRLGMRPSQRLVVIEQLIDGSESHPMAAFSDIQMLVACSGGRERSGVEIMSLLNGAGFEVLSLRRHPLLGLIECKIDERRHAEP